MNSRLQAKNRPHAHLPGSMRGGLTTRPSYGVAGHRAHRHEGKPA